MLNETQKAKIRTFLADKIMSDTIRMIFTNIFLKPRDNKDIYLLAASKIAIDLLDEAYKELDKLKVEDKKLVEKQINPGL